MVPFSSFSRLRYINEAHTNAIIRPMKLNSRHYGMLGIGSLRTCANICKLGNDSIGGKVLEAISLFLLSLDTIFFSIKRRKDVILKDGVALIFQGKNLSILPYTLLRSFASTRIPPYIERKKFSPRAITRNYLRQHSVFFALSLAISPFIFFSTSRNLALFLDFLSTYSFFVIFLTLAPATVIPRREGFRKTNFLFLYISDSLGSRIFAVYNFSLYFHEKLEALKKTQNMGVRKIFL